MRNPSGRFSGFGKARNPVFPRGARASRLPRARTADVAHRRSLGLHRAPHRTHVGERKFHVMAKKSPGRNRGISFAAEALLPTSVARAGLPCRNGARRAGIRTVRIAMDAPRDVHPGGGDRDRCRSTGMTAGITAGRRTVRRGRRIGKCRHRFAALNLAVADEEHGGRRLEERAEGECDEASNHVGLLSFLGDRARRIISNGCRSQGLRRRN